MKLIQLTMENFGPFRKRQVLPLADLGLVLVKGDNRISNASDSNGVGKTMIFDALSWLIGDQTLSGLRADDVAYRFDKKPCYASLELEEGERYLIEKGRRPAFARLVTVGKKPDDSDSENLQERIEKLMGFGFQTFKNAVVFTQKTFDRFASASQADQMKMIDEIQNLDFSEPLEKAKAWQKKAAERLDQINRDLSVAENSFSSHDDQCRRLQESLRSFDSEKAVSVARKEGEVNQAESSLDATILELASLQAERERFLEASREATKLTEMTREHNKMLADTTAEVEYRTKSKLHEQITETVNGLLAAGRCPTCRLKLAGKVGEVKEGFQKDLADAEEAIRLLTGRLTEFRNRRDALKKQIDDGTTALLERHNLATVEDFKRWEKSCSAEVVEAKKQASNVATSTLVRLQETLAAERSRTWTGHDALQTADVKRTEAKNLIAKLQEERIKVNEALAMAEYWVEAFGDRGIRSLMFDSVAPFLNERLAAHSEALSAGESVVTLSAMSALKKGGMKEKLSIGVEWEGGAGTYKACSAGQTRRIDLALFAAIQDLAESRSARPFPLRIWDEAGDSLDARGKELFAEWIGQEARRRGTGFVVTHDREFGDMLAPDHVWTVVMDESGSRVEIDV